MPDNPRILHVDDEEDIRMIVSLALEVVGGLEIMQCASGAEAIAAAPGFAPDILLLDVMMPEMTGNATLIKLRELPQFATTPVIFMTAKVQDEEIRSLKALGAIEVISKPFDPITLAQMIVTIWRDLPPANWTV